MYYWLNIFVITHISNDIMKYDQYFSFLFGLYLLKLDSQLPKQITLFVLKKSYFK